MLRRIVVVGASLAGLRAVETLRQLGFDGSLTLVGEEPHLPYDRPPLSKQVLQGVWDPQQTFFRKKEGYDPLAVDMRLGRRAVSLDIPSRHVSLDDGTLVEYDALIVATGARVRTLPGLVPRAGMHTLRGLDDAIALRQDLERASRVAVVGAGFIGLEVAASCRARGVPVTAIEALPQALSPALGVTVCRAIETLHVERGVELRTGVAVAEVLGDRRVAGVRLSDGSHIDAEVVVIGVGVMPNTEWLAGSGLSLDNGILCNAAGEAAPGVYAAGDVARIPNRWLGEAPRIEHWTNAVEQAAFVAGSVLGQSGEGFSSVPYFWSDQHDRKIQYSGRSNPGDRVEIVDGSVSECRFTAVYGRGDRLTACVSVGQPRTFLRVRKLVAERADWASVLETF